MQLKATDGDALPHLAPTVTVDKVIDDLFQRDAVQRITGTRRCGLGVHECGPVFPVPPRFI
jgi:hypothetical protein